MGFSVLVETGVGETLRIKSPEGHYGGKAILTFLTIYSGYISDFYKGESIEVAWYQELEHKAKLNLRKLAEIYYAGDWDYEEDEYDNFRRNHPTMYLDMNEKNFKRTINAVHKKWTPVNELTPMVEGLLHILPEMSETYWYSPTDTLDDFAGLLETFKLIEERHREDIEVRLKGV